MGVVPREGRLAIGADSDIPLRVTWGSGAACAPEVGCELALDANGTPARLVVTRSLPTGRMLEAVSPLVEEGVPVLVGEVSGADGHTTVLTDTFVYFSIGDREVARWVVDSAIAFGFDRHSELICLRVARIAIPSSSPFSSLRLATDRLQPGSPPPVPPAS